jgi:hypothetical protein
MHYSIKKDEYKRTIDANSLACANYVLNEATKTNLCGPTSIKLLNSNVCSDSYFTYYEFEKPQLAPNPTNNIVSISFFLPQQSTGVVQVFDAIGNLLLEPFNGMLLQGANNIQISALDNQLAQGIYFVKLVAINQTFINKVVIVN